MQIRLSSTVRKNTDVDPGNTVLTKSLLSVLGEYEVPAHGITPWPDQSMFEAIGRFQKTNNPETDQVMLPDGPTITKIGNSLAEQEGTEASEVAAKRGGRRRPSENRGEECFKQYEKDSALCEMIPPTNRTSRARC